ncbi:hypothetical protein KJY73_15240 [Bowmanella sp. Y26]|uniref:hypothetical protein n=1 Tax=Bowmanella yangjiangensis TaxID=2811230 RepID=UPI001BDD40E2|nr:hypothetical protein [Bowmanella yangjiangensis]MBT1064947.1 hypothetical protein [Bowmanella yangjiangensis]
MKRFHKFAICTFHVLLLLALFNRTVYGEELSVKEFCKSSGQKSLRDLSPLMDEIDKKSQETRILANGLTVNIDLRPDYYSALFEDCIQRKKAELLTNDETEATAQLSALMKKINFYSPSQESLNFQLDLEVANRQRMLSSGLALSDAQRINIEYLFEAYVQKRLFAKAEDLRIQFPEIEFPKLPTLNIRSDMTVQLLQVNDSASELNAITFDWHKIDIVVVASPLCSPSRRFSAWLLENTEYLDFFKKHSTWILPATGRLWLKEVLNANKQYPIPYYLVNQPEDWPSISSWSTPTLYFFKQKELVGQLVGWPQEGQQQKLETMISLLKK